jgi:hypothetical protein
VEVAENGPTDNLLVDEHFAGFDLGVMMTAAPLTKRRWLTASLGIFSGGTQNEQAQPAGMFAARVTSSLWKPLQIGAGVVLRPFTAGHPMMFPDTLHPDADRYPGIAEGVDARLTLAGLNVQASSRTPIAPSGGAIRRER